MIITTGMIMLVGGVLGMTICVILLLVLPGKFEKQKKKLLRKLEDDTE